MKAANEETNSGLTDRIVVLNEGEIMQVGSPRTFYEKLDNLFVTQFIGSLEVSILRCKIKGKNFKLPDHPPSAQRRSVAFPR